MSRENLDLSDNSGAAGQPRQRAHTPTRGAILEWIARPARITVVAALGLALGFLSVAYSQQAPLATAVPAPTPAPAIAEKAASPEAALAFAEVATPTPGRIVPSAALTATVVLSSDEVAAPAAVTPAADEPIVNQDELIDDLRAQLSARGGRRADGSTGAAAESASPTSVPAVQKHLITSEQAKLVVAATKTPTPRPVVKAATKTPTPRPVVKAATKTPTPRPVVKTTTTTTSSSSSLGQRVVSIALRYIGYRYTSGGISPSTGFDCSGFTYYVYMAAGHPIPRAIGSQYYTGVYVSRANLQPGDLVFFQNTYKAGLSHASIYIGGGRIVHARSETTGVTTDSLSTTYWSSHYLGARRP